jgi:hypothetical protein
MMEDQRNRVAYPDAYYMDDQDSSEEEEQRRQNFIDQDHAAVEPEMDHLSRNQEEEKTLTKVASVNAIPQQVGNYMETHQVNKHVMEAVNSTLKALPPNPLVSIAG